MQVEDRDISLRELMLETPLEVGTPFTERRGQNTENMHNAQVQLHLHCIHPLILDVTSAVESTY